MQRLHHLFWVSTGCDKCLRNENTAESVCTPDIQPERCSYLSTQRYMTNVAPRINSQDVLRHDNVYMMMFCYPDMACKSLLKHYDSLTIQPRGSL